MSAPVAVPADPEFSATARAIAAEQYRDDAHPFTRPVGQLWERETERDSATELYARFIRCGGETGTVFLRTRAARDRRQGVRP